MRRAHLVMRNLKNQKVFIHNVFFVSYMPRLQSRVKRSLIELFEAFCYEASLVAGNMGIYVVAAYYSAIKQLRCFFVFSEK